MKGRGRLWQAGGRRAEGVWKAVEGSHCSRCSQLCLMLATKDGMSSGWIIRTSAPASATISSGEMPYTACAPLDTIGKRGLAFFSSDVYAYTMAGTWSTICLNFSSSPYMTCSRLDCRRDASWSDTIAARVISAERWLAGSGGRGAVSMMQSVPLMPWSTAAISGNQWQSVVISGNQW